jgi:hypothetical protein
MNKKNLEKCIIYYNGQSAGNQLLLILNSWDPQRLDVKTF